MSVYQKITKDEFTSSMNEFIHKNNSSMIINESLDKGCFIVRDVFPFHTQLCGRWLREDSKKERNCRLFPCIEYVGIIDNINYYRIRK